MRSPDKDIGAAVTERRYLNNSDANDVFDVFLTSPMRRHGANSPSGTRSTSPMADLPKIGSETKRKRALSDDELALALDAVEEIGWPMGTAVQVLIQTGARRLEIAALRWDEIDWIRREIRLEGDRTKNGETHVIPLSNLVEKLLAAAPRVQGCPFVFFSSTAETPISAWSKPSGRSMSSC